MELKNKVALVTGATAGIGREAAQLLAAQGAEVIVTGRHAERGAATAGAITEGGGTARFVQADLADVASLRRLVQQAGEVDILVNNAAGVRVNTVAPGPTRTDTVVAAMGAAAAEQVGRTTLLGRQASPREIAEVILFLASDRASYITGATIAVDAGRTAV